MRLLFFINFYLFLNLCWGEVLPEQVLVVVNSQDEESIRIGEYYCQKRDVPLENIIALKMSKDADITWEQYVTQIYNPLKWELHKNDWIEGIRRTGKDDFGRDHYNVRGHKIGYLVLCKGVPIKILHEKELIKKEKILPKKIEFLRTGASVDAELALLAIKGTPVVGVVKNPCFKLYSENKQAKDLVVKVARLDGPSEEGVKKMIDGALIAEREGLMGRAYVDASGPYTIGNKWMTGIWQILKSMGFDGEYRENAPFKREDRFEAPAIYFGWWKEHMAGPFEEKEMEFAPGAIGVHLHSRSAQELRNDKRRWAGPLIAKGISATLGNVDEPYLQCTHYLQILFESLAKGKSWGDAGYEALPFLSWQAVLVGDPLYKPFKKNLVQQLRRIQAGGGTKYKQYAVMRQMHLMERVGRIGEAISLGKAFFEHDQGLALQLEISKLLCKDDRQEEALNRLGFMNFYSNFRPEVQGLACDIGDFLLKKGDTETGLGVYETLIEEADVSSIRRMVYADRGIRAARQAGVGLLAAHWKKVMNTENNNKVTHP